MIDPEDGDGARAFPVMEVGESVGAVEDRIVGEAEIVGGVVVVDVEAEERQEATAGVQIMLSREAAPQMTMTLGFLDLYHQHHWP